MPHGVMELGCLLHYDGESYFEASLGEPMSCIVGGCGPMGLGAIEYPMTLEKKPAMVVVTDVSNERIQRARQLIPEEMAAQHGIKLVYVNPNECQDQLGDLLALTGGKGYDDIFVYAPIRPLAEMADKLLGFDGCMNFFSCDAHNGLGTPRRKRYASPGMLPDSSPMTTWSTWTRVPRSCSWWSTSRPSTPPSSPTAWSVPSACPAGG